MNTRITLVAVLVLLLYPVMAQVREVTSRANEYKNSGGSSESSYSSSSGSDAGRLFLFDLFAGLARPMVNGLIYAQQSQLSNLDQEPWRTGIEFKLLGGLNWGSSTSFNSQHIRGNYGLFSTAIRRFDFNDVSGSFTTIDWQILQLNLINLDEVRWIIGSGISHEVQVDQTHLEIATELYFTLGDKWMPSLTYRRSGGGYPRKEFSAMMSYKLQHSDKLETHLTIGYLHQKVYEVPFHYPSIGVSLRIH